MRSAFVRRLTAAVLPALWIGLAAGYLEVAIRAVQHFAFHRLLFVGADFWWGAPLVTALLVAVPGVLLAAPFALTRFAAQVRYAVPLTLGLLSLLLLVPRLAGFAVLLLALGIAIQGSRWLARRPAGFESLVRPTLPLLLLPSLLTGVALMRPGAGSATRRAAVTSSNVLLIVLDTVRAIELGLYGFKPTTSPYLDAFAAQGVVFDQAFSTAPWTAPSHASLFTGRRIHELSIDWKVALDGRYPTLAELLWRQGYATAGFVANTEYVSAETGLARGFQRYEDYRLTPGEALRWTGLSRGVVKLWRAIRRAPPRDLPGRIGAEEINRRFLHWLDRRLPARTGGPFFAFLNYFDAHAPYFPPEPFWSRFLPGQPRRPRGIAPGGWSVPAVTTGRRAYQGAIAYLDSEIGALLDSLRVRDILRTTLVVVVGDHGEEFFEHGLMSHGNSLYAPSVRVPLFLVQPGRIPMSLRVREPVSLASLPATILELLGRPASFPGPSLVGHWTGSPPGGVAVTSAVTFARNLPAWYPVSHGALASARIGRYRFLLSPGDSSGELYDNEADPLEQQNLAGQPWAVALLRSLRDTAIAVLPHSRRR